jgi:hypothetical protein
MNCRINSVLQIFQVCPLTILQIRGFCVQKLFAMFSALYDAASRSQVRAARIWIKRGREILFLKVLAALAIII